MNYATNIYKIDYMI